MDGHAGKIDVLDSQEHRKSGQIFDFDENGATLHVEKLHGEKASR
jgi:hypothetical protein